MGGRWDVLPVREMAGAPLKHGGEMSSLVNRSVFIFKLPPSSAFLPTVRLPEGFWLPEWDPGSLGSGLLNPAQGTGGLCTGSVLSLDPAGFQSYVDTDYRRLSSSLESQCPPGISLGRLSALVGNFYGISCVCVCLLVGPMGSFCFPYKSPSLKQNKRNGLC